MNDTTWHEAEDGRRFRVYKGQCLCSPCWQARCECGHKLTAHDFDADGAEACARDALSRRDPLNRPDFAHPKDQCVGADKAPAEAMRLFT